MRVRRLSLLIVVSVCRLVELGADVVLMFDCAVFCLLCTVSAVGEDLGDSSGVDSVWVTVVCALNAESVGTVGLCTVVVGAEVRRFLLDSVATGSAEASCYSLCSSCSCWVSAECAAVR